MCRNVAAHVEARAVGLAGGKTTTDSEPLSEPSSQTSLSQSHILSDRLDRAQSLWGQGGLQRWFI